MKFVLALVASLCLFAVNAAPVAAQCGAARANGCVQPVRNTARFVRGVFRAAPVRSFLFAPAVRAAACGRSRVVQSACVRQSVRQSACVQQSACGPFQSACGAAQSACGAAQACGEVESACGPIAPVAEPSCGAEESGVIVSPAADCSSVVAPSRAIASACDYARSCGS